MVGKDILYFATLHFLLLCNGQAFSKSHFYTQCSERHWLSPYDLDVLFEAIFAFESGNMLFLEI